jgi:uncharacterized protein (TIGR02117 family)
MARLTSILFWFSCAAALLFAWPRGAQSHADMSTSVTVLIVSNGWHSKMVLPAPAVIASGLLPEAADFPDAAFLEIGWGDRAYFPAREKTLYMTLAAILWPTPSVLHVEANTQMPQPNYPNSEVIELRLTPGEFANLITALDGEFERENKARAGPFLPGLSRDENSNFYKANRSFYMLRTCNNWMARMLYEAGLPIPPFGIVTAKMLTARLHRDAASYTSHSKI